MSLLPTDFQATDFRWNGFAYQTARSLAAASELVYAGESFITGRLAVGGMRLVDYIDQRQTNTQLFIAADEHTVIVSFRGTKGVRDWVQNLKIFDRKHELAGEVHLGFDKALDSAWHAGLEHALNSSEHKSKRIYLTGHSLGGALATLAAAKLAHVGDADRIVAIHTFGQPLVGNRSFAKKFNQLFRKKFHRFRNDSDIVTKIPPFPYRHVQDLIKFDRKGRVVDGPVRQNYESLLGGSDESFSEAEDDAMTAAEFEGLKIMLRANPDPRTEAFFGLSGFTDHKLTNYLKYLRYHASREKAVSSNSEESVFGSANEAMEAVKSMAPKWLQKIDEARLLGDMKKALSLAEDALRGSKSGAVEMFQTLTEESRIESEEALLRVEGFSDASSVGSPQSGSLDPSTQDSASPTKPSSIPIRSSTGTVSSPAPSPEEETPIDSVNDGPGFSKGTHLTDDELGPELSIGTESVGGLSNRSAEAAFERIIDENNLLPVAFFERGARIQRSVARVVLALPLPGYPVGTGFGTGFLVAPNILMTNNHVIPDKAMLARVRFQFNYQLDIRGFDEPTASYLPRPDGFIHTNSKLDYTIVRLAPGPVEKSEEPPQPAGTMWGNLFLSPFLSFRQNQHFNVVQHPAGRRKEVSIQDNKISTLYQSVVRYTSDTEPGSSGSPVFNNTWELVALHHAGGEQDASDKWLNNEGIRIDRIVEDLRDAKSDDPDLLTELGIA